MSMNLAKGISLTNNWFSLLLLILFFNLLAQAQSQSCDQVAALPNDFSILLPQYEKLKRIHLLNYFFLDDVTTEASNSFNSSPNSDKVSQNHLKINLTEASVLKLQMTPYHVGLRASLKVNGKSHVLETLPEIPDNFNFYIPIEKGLIELDFYAINLEDEGVNEELKRQTSRNKICNVPYMKMEIYIEENEHLQNRLKAIKKETENLPSLQSININEMIDDLKIRTSKAEENQQGKGVKTELNRYKLDVSKNNKFDQKYNISVLAEWDIDIPQESLHDFNTTMSGPEVVDKFFLKFSFFGDFLLHGSNFLLLIRTSDLSLLNNYDCLRTGHCFLADKPAKNSMLLETILTPGSFKLLLIDPEMISKGSIKKTLKLPAIPLSASIKVKFFQKAENHFNCFGRHLPSNFDYLKQQNKIFEYKGDIVMNMARLYDEVEFSVEEESFIRLISFYPEGNNIDIELFEVLSNNEMKKMSFAYQTGQQDITSAIIDKLLNFTNPNSSKSKALQEKKLKAISHNAGESDGLMTMLNKGARYKLVFNYENSFFKEKERKNCEMFYLKLVIADSNYVKSFIPGTCPTEKNTLNDLIQNFENSHSTKDELSLISEKDQYVSFSSTNDYVIAYSRNFEIKTSVDLYIEVISEFVHSYIVPVVIPLKDSQEDINAVLHNKYKKLIFHENTLKLKLNAGKYVLALVNGLQQVSTDTTYNPLSKCFTFKLRLHSMKITGVPMKSWECNYIHYDVIPENLNDYIMKREKFAYYNKNLLLPKEGQKNAKVMKISTESNGYLLRIVAEYRNKSGLSSNTLAITLLKNGKVMKKAKEYIIGKDFKTDQIYLNYYLSPNSEYELKFENIEAKSKYYEYCRLFKLDLNLVQEAVIKTNEKCDEHSPITTDVIYERLMDVDNSFYKYGSKGPMEMFTPSIIKSTESKDTSVNDLEITHAEASRFTFKLDDKLHKSFTFDFEVKSFIAKGTVLIENYSSLGISAKVSSITDGVKEIIASEDLEGDGLFTIRSLMLPVGKYSITFYVNTAEKIYLNKIKGSCITFSASLLIENKPYDNATKNNGDKYESCPYLNFPDDLNIPGWINADTDYTINENILFKLEKDNNNVKRFTLNERSIFKFHIPNEDHNNFLTYINLNVVKNNKKSKLVETFEKEANYLLTVLEKGTYSLEFAFRGVGDTPLEVRGCNFFSVILSIVPISNVKGGIDSFNPLKRDYCDERGIFERKDTQIEPNTFAEHKTMTLSNVQEKVNNEGEETKPSTSSAKIIHLNKTNSNGKFVAELIFNNYIDVLYKIVVYEIVKKKTPSGSGNVLTEIPVMLTKFENFLWISFHFEAHKEFQLEISTANFDNYSVCSSIVFSYNYEEFTLAQKDNPEEEYINKKDACDIEDHMPSSFFSNENNLLLKYGGPQSATNGELNFYGEFLLPSSSTSLRSEFVIRKQSIAFIKIVPKYSNVKTSNIFIQIFRDKQIVYRFSHNEHNGIILTELDVPAVFNKDQIGKDNSSPYYLDLIFDRVLTDCESFEIVFVIIPNDLYIDEYLACNEKREKVPDSLTFDKTSQYSYSSILNLKEMTDFTKDEDGNYVKSVKIILTQASTISVDLEYVTSDNMMDILLIHDSTSNEGYSDEPLEIGEEQFQLAANFNGITTKKTFSANLKKGHYLIKIIYHSFFTHLLSRYFDKNIKSGSVCLGYSLEVEAVVIKNIKDSVINDDSEDPEIRDLNKSDFSVDMKNEISSVDPPEMKNIHLDSELDIELRFTQMLEENQNNAYFNNFVYLQDTHNKSAVKILPSEVNKEHPDSVFFTFEINKQNNFELMKCYKLFVDENMSKDFDLEAVTSLSHVYCTVDCDCNPASNYKCSQKGSCICYPPYEGSRCDKCKEGYKMNPYNQCVDEKLENAVCDEKLTCSGHGKCITQTFDAFGISASHRNGPCKCEEDFVSYETPSGYPATTFCNACHKPTKTFPFCTEKLGKSNKDALEFNFDSSCDEVTEAIKLPSMLYDHFTDGHDDLQVADSVLEILGGGQDVDGSLDLLGIFKVGKPDEMSQIIIPQDSIVRVFFESHEINRAKVSIYQSEFDEEAVAFTEGIDKTESFIAKLDAKSSPYFIKIAHKDLKYGCNRYRLKIVIKPLQLVLSELKCKSNINIHDMKSLLPSESVNISTTSNVFDPNKYFIVPDYLIYDPKIKDKMKVEYSHSGILTSAVSDQDFIYNIKLEVSTAVTITANVLFDFLTSDFSLTLRESSGKIIKNGEWLIPDSNEHVSDNDFINGLTSILDPGSYFLTLTQNLPANHLMQIIYDNEKNTKIKTHVDRCFKFGLHLQATVINKPDANLSTTKFESMYNRLVSVEPEMINNINVSKKFEIFASFEDSISPSLKLKGLTFKDLFYLENSNKEKFPPTHVYLQGSLSKVFLIIYNENVLRKDECYILKYNLEPLQSSNDKDKRITSDEIEHKYCTKSCDCNPNTEFKCDDGGKCQCEEPYTGQGCYDCVQGWISARGKCITEDNCRKQFCSRHGKCSSGGKVPSCICDKGFTGKDCSQCENPEDDYPDCIKISSTGDDLSYDNFLGSDKEEFSELDSQANKCPHQFFPHNLDTLGYLHLDGNMHISGKYSIKHVNNKHYSTLFSVKERSHVKVFLEHSKMSHIISIFLLDASKKLVDNGTIHIGQAGMGSASFIDVIVEPMRNSDNTFASYELTFFVKDTPLNEDEILTTYEEDAKLETLTDECFTVFMEMQIMTASKEKGINSLLDKDDKCKKESAPKLIPQNASLYDYHTVFYNSIEQAMTKYTHIRTANSNEITYFHYEYFYVPDHLDHELIIEIEVLSKFINSHVGVLLEIVEIPVMKVDHKKLNANMLMEAIDKDKKLTKPLCSLHCFSGAKKFNSVVISRILPSDTFFRIWFYDLSPQPIRYGKTENVNSSCVNYEVVMSLRNTKSNDHSLQLRKESALCISPRLPKTLNAKGFLGDKRYLEKWGFHILENFRIDETVTSGLSHETKFNIQEYHLLRMVVFHGRVDTDLELYNVTGEEVLIAKSNSKNFEDVLVAELPPGDYKIIFKFFPPSLGFHKCETIRMEFSMDSFANIQKNIDRMVARHQNSPQHDKIDIYELVKKQGNSILEKDISRSRYTIPLKEAFVINKDDISKYESSISLSEMTFAVEAEDSGKVELLAISSSDFLLVDANIYLSSIGSSKLKDAKILTGTHKKNMNILSSGPLEAGTYVLSLRYYRRLHHDIVSQTTVNLFRADFAEIEFDAMLVNRHTDDVTMLTSGGYITLTPFNSNKSSLSHNWICRNAGMPIPKTLSNLRYMEFNPDVHILDTFLVPPMGLGEEKIQFKLKFSASTMIRIYIECHSVDIDLELREKISHSEYKVVTASKESIHFETIMALISDDRTYEINIKFKGTAQGSEYSEMSFSDPSASCLTFKMEIALEKSHNYSCPDTPKYSKLTDLKPIPEVLPLKDGKLHSYDSRNIFLGDEKNSGYVYLLRSQSDKVLEFSSFKVESDIDFKVEIENDFMQAPLTLFLTTNNQDNPHVISKEINKLSHNALGIQDAFIVSYGEIFENKSVLLIKNLPIGDYKLFLYLPGLQTRFLNEPRVCSIYDILVEAKKSRYHFQEKEIINTAMVKEENLDTPVKVPLTLNNLKFLENGEEYINYSDNFYLRKNNTVTEGNNYDLYNTISFTLEKSSLVEFYVAHNILKETLQVAINGHTPYGEFSSIVLEPGKYTATIKVEDPKNNVKLVSASGADDVFKIEALQHLILFYIGISPAARVKEIYTYNNMISTYHQCKSIYLPQTFDYDKDTKSYSYHNDFFTFNKENLNVLKLSQTTTVLKSNSNRIIVEIGGDFVLNKLSMVIKSQHKTWKTNWQGNVGDIDIIVPSGTYSFSLELEEKIWLTDLDCIIFSLDVHIIDTEAFDAAHPLYNSHVFDSSHSHLKSLNKPKCQGSALPLELYKGADSEYHNIKDNGNYFLHIGKTAYFNYNGQQATNPNEVDINLAFKSLVRIITVVEKPNEFHIIPKFKFYSKSQKESYYLPSEISKVSHNLKERTSVWLLNKNTSESEEFYILELIQERYEELTKMSEHYHCPYYSIDIMISSVSEMVNRMECPKKEGSSLQYILPKKEITVEKTYHEKIKYSYFTEAQIADNYTQRKDMTGMEYFINLEITKEGNFHLTLNFGFDQLASQFDIYVSKVEDDESFSSRVIAFSSPFFYKSDPQFYYKRTLSANLEKGKYVINIVETMWESIDRNIRHHTNLPDETALCLPFSYEIDILPADENNSAAEIISIFPPGPINFKALGDDLNVKIVLSKVAYTKQHKPITYLENFMNIISSFYLVKKEKSAESNLNQADALHKIHPSKLEGSHNNKEWNILFLKDYFEADYDYELRFDSNYMFDQHYMSFTCNLKMPVFRVETHREAIVNIVDSIKNMKDKLNGSDLKVEEKKKIEKAPGQDTKCGEHGKPVYDNILKKEVCVCFDGFSGKFCDFCEGTYDKVKKMCIITDEDIDLEEPSEPDSESIDKYLQPSKPDSPSFTPTNAEYKSCEGGCVNGYCDSKIGKCVCDMQWTGPRCDKSKTTEQSKTIITNTDSSFWDFLSFPFKLFLGALIVFILIYLYSFVRRSGSAKSENEYNPLPSSEFELSSKNKFANSINASNDLELLNEDSNLLDFEINNEKKIKRKNEL